MKWLVVGLGNPGAQYQLTRHNIGFMVVDAITYSVGGGAGAFRNEHKSETKRVQLSSEGETSEVLFAKPQTYMNLSGEAVQSLMQFYKFSAGQLLVIHDDIDQPLGSIRFHKNRGHGGQNGVRSISAVLGTNDYCRLKIGIGRPVHPGFEIADYVLSAFSKDEKPVLTEVIQKACAAVESFVFKGLEKASSKFNK